MSLYQSVFTSICLCTPVFFNMRLSLAAAKLQLPLCLTQKARSCNLETVGELQVEENACLQYGGYFNESGLFKAALWGSVLTIIIHQKWDKIPAEERRRPLSELFFWE